MATSGCSDQIYKAYVNLTLTYAITITKDTKFLETICLHITDSTVTKSIVTNIITPENNVVELIDAQEGFPLLLHTEINRIATQFISYGGLRMLFLITPPDNLITPTDPATDTVLDVIGYVKSNANSLATVATLDNFVQTFNEFAVLYEKTQDKLTKNPYQNVCLFYDVDIGFMNDYLQFLARNYSKTDTAFLKQMIIGRRHVIENHENVISSAEESKSMRRNLLSFISCDSVGGFVGYFTSGTMNNTNSFWVAQVRYDLQYSILNLILRGIPYNALTLKEKVSVGINCLRMIQMTLVTVLEDHKKKGVILQYYQAIVPNQTWEARYVGEVRDVKISYLGMNIVIATYGEISTDIQAAIIESNLLSLSSKTVTSTKSLFPKKEGAKYESWGAIIQEDIDTPDNETKKLVSFLSEAQNG